MKTFKSCMWLLVMLLMPMMVGASVVFDESTPDLTFTGDAGTGTDGSYGIIGFSAGTASADIMLTAGQVYKITASRKVLTNTNLSFYLNLNGTNYIWDAAYTPDAPDTFQAETYLGYYKPATATATVMVHSGGPWMARLDYLSFDATSDVFFDEFSSPTFTGAAGTTAVSSSGALTPNPGSNGMGFGGAVDNVSGIANLIAGVQYNVYARRHIIDNGNCGYDISLGGTFFAHDAASLGAPNDGAAEGLIGQYTATSAATNVLLSNGGPWAARVDYLRFEAIPEPATIALLGLGFAVLRRRK